MPWAKIDDRLFLNPKWLATPPAARGLWVSALSYTSCQLTDGKILAAILPILGGTVEDAEALVNSGLWDRDGDNYQFHDYYEWNPTKEEVEAKRDSISRVRSEAGKRSGEARRSKANANCNHSRTNNEQNANKIEQTANPEPEPEPVPIYSVSKLTEIGACAPDSPQSKKPKIDPTDDQWIDGLRSQKAYEGIDIDRELSKCQVWCDTNGATFSRRRFVNWLNKADRPLQRSSPTGEVTPPRTRLTAAEERFAAEEARVKQRRAEMDRRLELFQ